MSLKALTQFIEQRINNLEDQKEYGKKTTATDLLKYSCGFALAKTFENTHKGNILANDYDYLMKRLDEEVAEFKKAWRIMEGSRTDKNKNEFGKEGGDCINFISALMGKAAGYTEMERK